MSTRRNTPRTALPSSVGCPHSAASPGGTAPSPKAPDTAAVNAKGVLVDATRLALGLNDRLVDANAGAMSPCAREEASVEKEGAGGTKGASPSMRRATPSAKGPIPGTGAVELYDELAYKFDGSLEGLFSAVFASYARHEDPSDILSGEAAQVRLGQHVVEIDTHPGHAERVRTGFRQACGPKALAYATRAALSDEAGAATAVYRYIRHGMDLNVQRSCTRCRRRSRCAGAANPTGRVGGAHCPRVRGAMTSDLSHPAVQPVFKLARTVFVEQEHLLQFTRFEHLEGGLWFARCNPKANALPLVMDHFAGRFNTQPFLIYDEAHHLAGVYEGRGWSLVRTEGLPEPMLPDRAADEATMQHAWRRFYRAVSVESRYNPELRQRLMPKRFWRNLTEMQEELPALAR